MGIFNKKKFKIEKKYLLSEESAYEEISKIFERYDFDIEGEADPEIKKNKETIANNLVEFFRLGYLELGEDGITIIQKLKYPSPNSEVKTISYPKFRGKHKRAMDQYKPEELQAKAFSLVGSVSGLGVSFFDMLEKYDIKVAEALGMLFLL